MRLPGNITGEFPMAIQILLSVRKSHDYPPMENTILLGHIPTLYGLRLRQSMERSRNGKDSMKVTKPCLSTLPGPPSSTFCSEQQKHREQPGRIGIGKSLE
ncbi:unnamed protein product [Ceratitis capitata]|uniref:(Mediterranean fruit fly) hypothetical protein n=1 Tax=Ceratitis capitata TaxID=7213 RepID=A0A811UAU9_CERCA|nr:unnamed protein product [Ceratitis capitata]